MPKKNIRAATMLLPLLLFNCTVSSVHASGVLYNKKKDKNTINNQDLRLNAIAPPADNPYNNAPVIKSITPENNSEFLAGTKIKISIGASDADKDSLQYKFSIGGSTKQNWSSANTYIWQTSPADKGAVNITCEASDNKGGKAYNTITCRIIDPAAEEILQKLSNNYANVHDFTADMLLTVTLNGEILDKPQYCRYYFKAPQKEKTETYTDSSRSQITDITILNGADMILINPQTKEAQKTNILEETGLSTSQLNQMDIYYDTKSFLSSHTVTKNSSKTDLDKKIICLTAKPKTKNKIYTKLELLIDYNKGILAKNTLYNKGPEGTTAVEQWVQIIETTQSQQMPNNTWLPVKMTKTPNLSSGKMESKLEYSNLNINTGLRDEDFTAENLL